MNKCEAEFCFPDKISYHWEDYDSDCIFRAITLWGVAVCFAMKKFCNLVQTSLTWADAHGRILTLHGHKGADLAEEKSHEDQILTAADLYSNYHKSTSHKGHSCAKKKENEICMTQITSMWSTFIVDYKCIILIAPGNQRNGFCVCEMNVVIDMWRAHPFKVGNGLITIVNHKFPSRPRRIKALLHQRETPHRPIQTYACVSFTESRQKNSSYQLRHRNQIYHACGQDHDAF